MGDGSTKTILFSPLPRRLQCSSPSPARPACGDQTHRAEHARRQARSRGRDKGINEVLNIGGAETISLIELARLIGETSGKPIEPEFREFGDAGVREKERQAFARILSVAKARKVLGYGSRVGLREGLTRTYEWYLKNS